MDAISIPKFTVEANVQLPPRGRWCKYPFRTMTVGDSFVIPDEVPVARVRAAASYWGKRHDGQRFCIRRIDGAYRCWRLV